MLQKYHIIYFFLKYAPLLSYLSRGNANKPMFIINNNNKNKE